MKPIGVDAAYGILLSYVTATKGGIMNAMNYSNEAVDNALFATLNEAEKPSARRHSWTFRRR